MLACGVSHTSVEADNRLLGAMAESLNYSVAPDIWNLGRVGLVGPEPVYSSSGSKCGLVIGQVFDDSQVSLRDLVAAPWGEVKDLALGLNGSFCIVLADLHSGGVKLLSDRYGSQPMFYALSDGLVFGSQAIAVLQSPGVSPEIDIQALFEFMAFQQVFGTRTLAKSISILPPASILTFDGDCSIEQYWTRRYRPVEASEDEFAEEVAAAFSRTMSRIGGEAPGLMLSGGLDSRMVFAACKRPPRCFTMGDYANSEYRLAARIAETRGVGTELLQRDPDHYVRHVDTAVRIGSGMYNFYHAHQLGFIEHIDCDVMMHGNSLESPFRGAHLPKKQRTLGRLRVKETLIPLSDETFARVARQSICYSLMARDPSQVFSPDVAGRFDEAIDECIDHYRREGAKQSDDLYDQFLSFSVGNPTKNATFLFQLAIRPYMREGSLLFDNDVLDLVLKMPVRTRENDRIWLKALARLSPEIAGVPDANTGWHHRVPRIVAQVLNAPKNLSRHVSRKQTDWEKYQSDTSWPYSGRVLRHNSRMQDLFASAIDDLDPGLFNVGRLKDMLDAHMAGSNDWTTLLHLSATFARWRSISTTTASKEI